MLTSFISGRKCEGLYTQAVAQQTIILNSSSTQFICNLGSKRFVKSPLRKAYSIRDFAWKSINTRTSLFYA